MVPMIAAAQEAASKRGQRLKLLASPWSPPAWMKAPVLGQQSMLLSAKPNGLLSSMQRPWATYFNKWISAYKAHGIDVWAVTVQNEPEATAGWEVSVSACGQEYEPLVTAPASMGRTLTHPSP